MNTKPASKTWLASGMGALAVISLVSALAAAAGPAQAATPHAGAASVAPGTISTVAGGVGGPGKATTVSLNVCGLAAAGGNVYLGGAGTVREVNSAGYLTTPAGDRDSSDPSGVLGLSGPAAKAQLGTVCGVAVDHSGSLVLAEAGPSDYRIMVVPATSGTFYGKAMTARHIYSVAGDGAGGIAQSGAVARKSPLTPEDVTVDSAGNLVIAEDYDVTALVQVVATTSGTFYGQAMTAGHIYTVAGGGTAAGNGVPATQAALGDRLGQAQTDAAGNLVIANLGASRIQVVAETTGTFYGQPMTAGDIYTVAGGGTASGDGVPATSIALYDPTGVTVDGAGNLVIGAGEPGIVRVVATTTGTFYGQAMTAGDIYSTSLITYGPVAVDGNGNLIGIDGPNGIDGTRAVRVLAASTGTFYGIAMTAGGVYTIAGTGHGAYSGNGGPATSAELPNTAGVASDSAGDLFIATGDQVLVSPAATGTDFTRPMTAGHIYSVAGGIDSGYSGDGGPATRAELYVPTAVAVDSAGNLVIADTGDSEVQVVAATTGTFYGVPMTAGDIYTVAGVTTHSGYSGDGGPATRAELDYPAEVATTPSGGLLIGDSYNGRVRLVTG